MTSYFWVGPSPQNVLETQFPTQPIDLFVAEVLLPAGIAWSHHSADLAT